MTSPTGDRQPPGHDTPRRRRRAFGFPGRFQARGFSLMELILVLVLLAVTAAMTAPMLGRFSRGRSAADAAAHLLAVMQYGQDQAVLAGHPYRLHVDTAQGAYWLTAMPQGVDQRLDQEIGRTFTLPDTLSLTLEGSQTVMNESRIQFDPDGGHDVALIRLTDAQDRDRQIVIGCASSAEPYRIGTPQEVRQQGQW